MFKKIAIFGGGSQIAKDFIGEIIKNGSAKIDIFTRRPQELTEELFRKYHSRQNVYNYYNFIYNSYDVVINFIGTNDPKILEIKKEIAKSYEVYDDLIIRYLERNPKTLYIFISSGAVYGDYFMIQPKKMGDDLKVKFMSSDFYGISKSRIELKHRNLIEKKIIDLRIFGYVATYKNMKSGSMISEIIEALKKNKVLVTNNVDIWRDYIGAIEFYEIIFSVIEKDLKSIALDVYSLSPLSKSQLFDQLVKKHNFKYEINNSLNGKENYRVYYYSNNKKLSELTSYYPKSSSIEIAMNAIESSINCNNN